MGVVDGLNAASAGHIILCCCEFQVVAIADIVGRLHQTLAECATSHQHRTVHILQRSRHNLGRRSRAAIGQHNDRQLRLNRLFISSIDLIHLLVATLHFEHLRALRQEHRQNLDRLLHNTAAIATVVEHQTTQVSRLAQCHQLTAQIGRTALAEIVVGDVADRVVQPARIRNARNRDSLTAQRQLHLGVIDQTSDLQSHLGIGVALQAVAHLLDGHTLGRLTVDFEDSVADLDTRTVGRTALVRLCKAHIITLLANQRAHAAILARGQHLELAHLLFGHIGRVGVERRGQSHRRILHHFGGLDRIDIHHAQLAHHIDQHLDMSPQVKVTRMGRHQHHRPGHHRHNRRRATSEMFKVLRHFPYAYRFPSDR